MCSGEHKGGTCNKPGSLEGTRLVYPFALKSGELPGTWGQTLRSNQSTTDQAINPLRQALGHPIQEAHIIVIEITDVVNTPFENRLPFDTHPKGKTTEYRRIISAIM